jgi:CDP-diacylglycerol--glycerol-3-phosphate 3-phosphatidyltransferase
VTETIAYWEQTKRQWNWSNAVTASRALSVALIPFAIVIEELFPGLKREWLLGALVAYAGISDWLDGYLARLLNEVTPIGAVSDPLADKIFTVAFLFYATFSTESVYVAMLTTVTVLYDIDNTYQRRFDIANAFKGIAVVASKPVTWFSKTKTAVLFVFMFAILFPQFLPLFTIDQFALLSTGFVLWSWWINRRNGLLSVFSR